MRKATMIAAAVAAGVFGTGAVVTPVVVAASEDQGTQQPGPRWGDRPGPRWDGDEGPGGMGPGLGYGMGRGTGPGMSYGPRGGAPGDGAYGMRGPRGDLRGDCLADAESGTLTDEQKQQLADQAVLEKISHDAYVAFAEDTGDPRFEHIAWSETRHLEAVRTLMDRYDVADPTKGLATGELSGDAATTYQDYLDAGSASTKAALATAREIEQKDIDGLRNAAEGLDAPDVQQLYDHLERASEMHLAVFSR
jgi:hypothetical protein